MSGSRASSDSDKESLNDWMLVEEADQEAEEGTVEPPNEEDEGQENEEEDDSENAEAIGQKLEEIKDSSASDIEILELPQDVRREDLPAYNYWRWRYISGYSNKGEEADNESISSADLPREERIRKRRSDKSEATQDEETDLSLLSNASLPEDMPQIKPEAQYVHIPDSLLNQRLNLIVALTVACVLGLGLGHFLGWSSRTLWDSNLNAAQILDNMEAENADLDAEILRLQGLNINPHKIKGKDGREARELREEINNYINSNEEIRSSIVKMQVMALPDVDKNRLTDVVEQNHNKRVAIGKLKHLVPSLEDLRASVVDLKAEKEALQVDLTHVRFQEQPIPRELNSVLKEIDGLKQIIKDALKKKSPPANVANAKSYISFVSQVLAAMSSIHDFNEGGTADRIGIASDVFTQLAPKDVKIPPQVQDKVKLGRKKFEDIKSSLASKWTELKKLTKPDTIRSVGHSTLTKMNRVIVNVVNKVKEIGYSSIMRKGKTSPEKTITTLTDTLDVLDDQFTKAWNTLEAEILLPEEQQSEVEMDDSVDEDEEESLTDGFETESEVTFQPTEDKEEKTFEEKIDNIVVTKEERVKQAMEKHKEKPVVKERKGEAKKKKEVDLDRTKRELKEAMQAKHEQEVKTGKPEVKTGKKDKNQKVEKGIPSKKRRTVEEKKKEQKEKKDIKPLVPKKKEEPKEDMDQNGRYFKGQYNRYDKNKYTNGQEKEDDVDDDEGGSNSKQSRIMKHYEKPQKKSFFRDDPGPNKKFIRRKGKEYFYSDDTKSIETGNNVYKNRAENGKLSDEKKDTKINERGAKVNDKYDKNEKDPKIIGKYERKDKKENNGKASKEKFTQFKMERKDGKNKGFTRNVGSEGDNKNGKVKKYFESKEYKQNDKNNHKWMQDLQADKDKNDKKENWKSKEKKYSESKGYSKIDFKRSKEAYKNNVENKYNRKYVRFAS